MAKNDDAATRLFSPKGSDQLYRHLMSLARDSIGTSQFVEDPKQTCVHITAGKGGVAYAGVHPRKSALLLNIRLHKPVKSDRIRKVEQISKNRYDCELILSSASDVDAQVLGWLAEAFQAASDRPPRKA